MRCVYRCFQEALAQKTVDLIVLLCESDMTFRAKDLEKLLAYIDHADIVNGTRIVEQLRDYTTQLSTFMYYGNFFVGKLLELKHPGRGTFTDVGTTYHLSSQSWCQQGRQCERPAGIGRGTADDPRSLLRLAIIRSLTPRGISPGLSAKIIAGRHPLIAFLQTLELPLAEAAAVGHEAG